MLRRSDPTVYPRIREDRLDHTNPDGTSRDSGTPAPCISYDQPIYPSGYFGPYVGPDPHRIPGFDPELPDNSPPEWINEPNTRTLESPHD